MKFFITLLLAASAFTVRAQMPPAGKEGIEWCDIWISHANETKLPRVLLLGDSITRGYYTGVEKRLDGKAYVSRLATSAFVTDPALLGQVAMVLENTKFDVIHFNNGMHGWQHGEGEYAKGLPVLIDTIRKHAPNAKLIWASTTSLNEAASNKLQMSEPTDARQADAAKLMLQSDLRQKSNKRVDDRNSIAQGIMNRENIPIDDLHALTIGHPEFYSGDVHFNEKGKELQSDHVSAAIQKVLP